MEVLRANPGLTVLAASIAGVFVLTFVAVGAAMMRAARDQEKKR